LEGIWIKSEEKVSTFMTISFNGILRSMLKHGTLMVYLHYILTYIKRDCMTCTSSF